MDAELARLIEAHAPPPGRHPGWAHLVLGTLLGILALVLTFRTLMDPTSMGLTRPGQQVSQVPAGWWIFLGVLGTVGLLLVFRGLRASAEARFGAQRLKFRPPQHSPPAYGAV